VRAATDLNVENIQKFSNATFGKKLIYEETG
jgi:hypothetical protein